MKLTFLKEKKSLIAYFILSIILVIPSITFLIKNGTIYEMKYYYTYIMDRIEYQYQLIINVAIFVSLFILLTIIYFYILKNISKIFKSKKQLMIFIIVIGIIFMLIIPQTSMDVYSYIGNGWTDAHYGENPYYTPILEIVKRDGNISEMYGKVANCWVEETVIYGPAWSLICKVLSGISGGNIDMALLIFKITSLIIFLCSTILIDKITNKKIFMAMFALNPLVLFEGLSNVHNDLFLVFFMLLGIYFITKKKSLFLSVACIAIATAIKYLSIIILPFIIIYYLRNEKIKTRVIKTLLCAIEFVVIIIGFYMIYIKDISVLSGIFIQQNKYSRSIALVLLQLLGGNTQLLDIIKLVSLLVFVIAYCIVIFKLFFNKNSQELSIQKILRKYNIFILIFTFILITNFNAWYLLWIFPTIMWQKSNMIKLSLYASIGALMSYAISYATYIDDESVGAIYLGTIIMVTILMYMIEKLGKKQILLKCKGK